MSYFPTDVAYVCPSLAKGLGNRWFKNLYERNTSNVPRHLAVKVPNLVRKLAKGVHPRKRTKMCHDILRDTAKCCCLLAAIDSLSAHGIYTLYTLQPHSKGKIHIGMQQIDFATRQIHNGVFSLLYLNSAHVLHRMVQREQATSKDDFERLYNLLQEMLFTVMNTCHVRAIKRHEYTGSIAIPVPSGGAFLGEVVDWDGSGAIQINTYIDKSLMQEHNWDVAIHDVEGINSTTKFIS